MHAEVHTCTFVLLAMLARLLLTTAPLVRTALCTHVKKTLTRNLVVRHCHPFGIECRLSTVSPEQDLLYDMQKALTPRGHFAGARCCRAGKP